MAAEAPAAAAPATAPATPGALPTTMTAIVWDAIGGPQTLRLSRTEPVPKPKSKEILIRVAATSVNPVDYKIITGAMGFIGPKPPLIVCKDVAGTVVQLGPGASAFAVGDEVYCDTGKVYKAAAEYVAVPESYCAKKPSNLTFLEAASLPVVAATSYEAVLDVAKLTAGQRLLVLGGSTATGMMAIQFAHARGIRVVVTGSQRSADKLRELGAEQVLDYRTEEWWTKLEHENLDAVYDCVGDATSYERSAKVLKKGGSFVSITSHGPVTPGVIAGTVASTIGRGIKAAFGGTKFTFFLTSPNGARMQQIRVMFESELVRPIIDRTYPLLEIQKAFAYIMEGHAFGKVVIDIAGSLPVPEGAVLVQAEVPAAAAAGAGHGAAATTTTTTTTTESAAAPAAASGESAAAASEPAATTGETAAAAAPATTDAPASS